jgi:phospholipid/cholesterol/gamma-HCH transport system permease protein
VSALAAASGFAGDLRRALKRGMPQGELVRQTYEIGNRSMLLVVGGMMFFGAVLMAHGSVQARRIVGDFSVVGPPYFELLLRELGPTFAGILAAVRLGAALSAELASMQVTEQVDALKMSAGDPISDLVLPRLIGGLIAVPCLIIGGTMAAALVSAAVANVGYGADGGAFLDAALVTRGDLTAFAVKTLLYGIAIPTASVLAGMRAHGGAAAVGEATTKGVVWASVSVLIIDWAVSGVLSVVGM